MSKSQLSQPKLRFKGFEGGWIQKKLIDISYCLNDKRTPISSNERTKIKGIYPYMGATGIIDYLNFYTLSDKLLFIAEDCGNFYDYRNKDIAYYYEGECVVNNHVHVFKSEDNNIKYIFYWICRKNITNLLSGENRPKLTKKELFNISFFSSVNILEQQKIAQFFSLLDHHIKLWERKLELCQLKFKYFHKKFFYKKISLEKYKISDFYKIPESTIIKKEEYNKYNKITLKLNNKGIEILNECPVATPKGRAYILRNNGELLIGKQNIHNKSFYVLENIPNNCVTSNALMTLIPNREISNKYLFYFMMDDLWIHYVDSLNSSTGQKEYSEKQILNLPFDVLDHWYNKTQILSIIDAYIILLNSNIQKLKDRKKYYLNNLFI